MIFHFKNIGIIESADIEIKGLTVVSGLNDTGKSFLSKSVYSVIKAVNESAEQADIEKQEQIRSITNHIFSVHRQSVPFTPQKQQEFNPTTVATAIVGGGLFKDVTLPEQGLDILKTYKNRVIADIRAFSSSNAKNSTETFISRVESIYEAAIPVFIDDADDERKLQGFFDEIIIDKLFQGQFCRSNSNQSASILLKEGATDLLEIKIKNNKTESFRTFSPLLHTDATIIDTPTIIQLTKFITTSLAFPGSVKRMYRQRTELPYPYYDLVQKIDKSSANTTVTFAEIFAETEKIIGGKFEYKVDEGWIVFEKDNGQEIRSFNIANGVKSFGLIQLLLGSETINPNSVLIIDEPEVHLHPSWEIEYARLIVLLSKAGIPILVSSHSPYFLRAITVYVKSLDTADITRFYFGEKDLKKQTTSFRDVTHNLDDVFRLLAEPMQKLFLND